MEDEKISVIIINHKRPNHLKNVINALSIGSDLPDEVIIVEMDDKPTVILNKRLDILHYLLTDYDPKKLPIARARNTGAMLSNFERLVFLDVDCIPSKDYIFNWRQLNMKKESLYMGVPLYLDKPVELVTDFSFKKDATHHPDRPQLENNLVETDDCSLFWSLCFCIQRTLYKKIGGFDENYLGYGAEDTDFAFKANDFEIPIILTNFEVYHQPHIFFRPPLDNLDNIISNANLFYSKWKVWPMEKHLSKFKKMKLIEWNENEDHLIVKFDSPSNYDIEPFLVKNEPYA